MVRSVPRDHPELAVHMQEWGVAVPPTDRHCHPRKHSYSVFDVEGVTSPTNEFPGL